MHIERLQVFALPLRFKGGAYVTSYGARHTLENLAVVATTDSGLTGMAEIARVNLKHEAPTSIEFINDLDPALRKVLGGDPCDAFQLLSKLPPLPPHRVNITAAVDCLCLDLTAKSAGLPAFALLGGHRQAKVPLYFSIGQDAPGKMAASAREAIGRGFRILQMKIGEGVAADVARIEAVLAELDKGQLLFADANGGYSPAGARRLVGTIEHPGFFWEELCASLDENLAIADEAQGNIVLDQCLVDLKAYARVCKAGSVAGCGIKPTLQGGISAARVARDLCLAHDMALKVDDVWAAEPATLASLNLALGVPSRQFLGAIDQWAYFEDNLSGTAGHAPAPVFRHDGEPGLGLSMSTDSLGEAVLDLWR